MAYAAAQMSYLVDLGMRPDADDATAENFSRSLSPHEEAEFERIGYETSADEGDDIARGDDDGSGADDGTPGDDDADPTSPPIQRDENGPLPPVGGANGDNVSDIVRREIAAHDAARRERLDFIRSEAGDDIPNDLVQRAMAEDWDQSRVSREFLRALRTRPSAVPAGSPAGHVRSHGSSCTLEALQGAILLRQGFELDSPIFARREARAVLSRSNVRGEWITRIASGNGTAGGNSTDERFLRARDEAHRYEGRSLPDICREALRISGRDVPSHDDDMIRRALSTATLDAVFSPSVNMQIIAAYLGVEDTTAGWTNPTDVRNFKTNERGRLTKGSGMKKLARGGTPNPIEFSDETEKYKIARYAGKFEISEEDIIDDSFGALSEHTPRELGEMAAELKPNLVFAILLANAAMRDGTALFHADHANLLALALDAAGVDAAKVAMRTQTENERNIRNAMRFLIVPEQLDFKARQLMASAELRNAAGTGPEGTANPLQNRFTVVSDPRLDNGVVDPDTGTKYNGSSTQWFGAAAAGSNSIEVGYRTGTGRAPRMTTYMLPGDRYGMGWKCDLDIGAKAIDWRSMVKSTPA
ncbi:phage major capsid protein [Allorhodopirellula heiligendammensis]|uniref:Mu-like prophage major head subunit gpT n=1 Tax=Allorhodopirellula heiligendammensis TaxID=2714739 RepID=A0A5C6BXE9_9BACT|nr:hypothetical protein [Allorhodopirellula heiligendammensis]TWU15966.1 Mu-like prophage major head subunit gpT [Allorhodopirellula heiligendammensis]